MGMRTIFKTEVLAIARGLLSSLESGNHTPDFIAGYYKALDSLAIGLDFDGVYPDGTVNQVRDDLPAPTR